MFTQHKLMICQMKISDEVWKVKTMYVSKCKVLKLKEDEAQGKIQRNNSGKV